jgi:hypothetical protein
VGPDHWDDEEGRLSFMLIRTETGEWVGPGVHVSADWLGRRPALIKIDDHDPVVLSDSTAGKVMLWALDSSVARVEKSAVNRDDDEVFEVNLAGSRDAVRAVISAARVHGYEPPDVLLKMGLL